MSTQAPRTGILRLTPAASRRTHLLAASLMWTLAGLGLCTAGTIWMTDSRSRWVAPVAILAIAAGALKGRFILDRAGERIIRRIDRRGDGWCIGGFLSWRAWCLVATMMVLGRLLRLSPLPLLPRGAIYLAIGVALLIASRGLWIAFRRAGSVARP